VIGKSLAWSVLGQSHCLKIWGNPGTGIATKIRRFYAGKSAGKAVQTGTLNGRPESEKIRLAEDERWPFFRVPRNAKGAPDGEPPHQPD
jgi:hypothetical protein